MPLHQRPCRLLEHQALRVLRHRTMELQALLALLANREHRELQAHRHRLRPRTMVQQELLLAARQRRHRHLNRA